MEWDASAAREHPMADSVPVSIDGPGLRRWLDGYAAAWTGLDAGRAALLFTEDATYHESPFQPPCRGLEAIRAYWDEVARSQRDVVFRHEPLGVIGDRGIARWSAAFSRVASSVRVELDGVFVLTFAADGRCRELREWWRRRESPAH
jgi:hypothetical protein